MSETHFLSDRDSLRSSQVHLPTAADPVSSPEPANSSNQQQSQHHHHHRRRHHHHSAKKKKKEETEDGDFRGSPQVSVPKRVWRIEPVE
jgi:hypothetical protein